MPTLQFKGKNIIWNHHLSIPYHTLEEVPSLNFRPERADGHTIIEGDNLLALKALLPQYAGRIKCIYIDPPYNTGNEHWVYNDRVNSPLIRDWLGKEVGKDDLTRHDKWLCMMVPRLRLLRELLSEDGSIFISIDDIEVSLLRCLMDEIFLEENYLAEIIVHSNPKGRVMDRQFSKSHEYILTYAKNIFEADLSIEKTEKEIEKDYPEQDDKGKYRLLELRNTHREFGKLNRPNLYYPFFVEESTLSISLEKRKGYTEIFPDWDDGYKGCWSWGQDKSENEIESLVAYRNGNKLKIYRKSYSIDEKGNIVRKKLKTIWYENEFNTEKGQGELGELFKERLFPSPKPISLIKNCILSTTEKEGIILDSFSGSGTTMHAVMELNKEDGGNRECILVQMTEATEPEPKKNICKDITRERIKRAIEKYKYQTGFRYFRLGIPIDSESMLSGNLPKYKQFAEYVYYLCTGSHLEKKEDIDESRWFVGKGKQEIIFLIYKQKFEELSRLALNISIAEALIKEFPKKKKIVYAPACFLEDEYMREHDIEFVGIPYNLFQRNI